MTDFRFRSLGALADLAHAEVDQVTRLYAGGTDLGPLQHDGILTTDLMIDIKTSDIPTGIEFTDAGWRIGALTTLSEIMEHEELGRSLPLIREALAQTATQQIRNRATIGGNLLQRPRCPYFRDPGVSCWLKYGSGCPARDGHNEFHSLIDTSPCLAVQPSDLASVLVALGAELELVTPVDEEVRTVPVAEFLLHPTEERRRLHDLHPDEVITAVTIPERCWTWSSYLKAMDRATWQFALVGLAVCLVVDEEGVVEHARVVATAIGAAPHRLESCEARLEGSSVDDDCVSAAAHAATQSLVSQSHNNYKIWLLQGLITRSLEGVPRQPTA